jgi:hypothetical protein
VAGKDVKRTCGTCRYQLQHPHFRRSKARRVCGEFFEQFQYGLPKLRQDAEILVEQVEPILRLRLSIGLPGRAGGFEMIVQDFDGRQPPLGHFFRRVIADADVRLNNVSFEAVFP